MNRYVPDFEMVEDCTIPTSSALARNKKSITSEDEIMELLWQNGQVVVQSQTQMSMKKPPFPKYDDASIPVDQSVHREIRSSQQQQQQLFIQEDEMAAWLHFDQDFSTDLLYPSSASVTCTTNCAPLVRSIHNPEPRPQATVAAATAARPPIPPPRKPETIQNFACLSRQKARGGVSESGPSNFKPSVRESTVVDSNETPALGCDSRISEAAFARSTATASSGDNGCGTMSGAALAGTTSRPGGANNRDMMTYDMTVTSSPGGSSSAELPCQKPPAKYRKRKGREEDMEDHSEDVELESLDAKKKVCGSTSTKRSRAAEVHNLSERRRRDRINEKMRALQELIPRCNKSDKASMLDEAIEYLKSLQLQVQMMSMGCSMVPMMFPGIQQYMPPLGMGMGMGMGMDMGMSRPVMSFPNVLAGQPLPTPAAAAHLGPRFPMPAFHMPPASAADPSRTQAAGQSDPRISAISTQNQNQQRVPNFSDPYQQYLALQQMQIPTAQVLQNQATARPSTSKHRPTQGDQDPYNHHSGA